MYVKVYELFFWPKQQISAISREKVTLIKKCTSFTHSFTLHVNAQNAVVLEMLFRDKCVRLFHSVVMWIEKQMQFMELKQLEWFLKNNDDVVRCSLHDIFDTHYHRKRQRETATARTSNAHCTRHLIKFILCAKPSWHLIILISAGGNFSSSFHFSRHI